MFKATNMGAVEGMRGFVLTGTGNLRRFLIDHLDTVQLAAASGMPVCDVMVSEDGRGAHLQALVRVPNRYCRDMRVEKALNYEQWSSAMNGDFTFLYDELTQAALQLMTGVPNFYHTRITQYKKLYLYTFTKEVRTVLRDCWAAYREHPQEGMPEMEELFRCDDLCLMLRRRGEEYVLSIVSDDQEKLLGTYPETALFGQPGHTLEELLWRIFNEYMRDTYRVKVSSVMVLKYGSKLRVEK